MSKFEAAFQDLIKDIYSAEKQVLKSLSKAGRAATDAVLQSGIEDHVIQTETHLERLEQIADIGGFNPSGKVSAGAKGIIEQISEAVEEHQKGAVLDAIITFGALKFEHYEIANYGTAIAWAKLLGHTQSVSLLQETLAEEESTNQMFSQLADTKINYAAMHGYDKQPVGSNSGAK